MKDYKRLTKKSWHDTKFCVLNEREVLHRLWVIENKIENGTLIELPCKVGDYVQYKGNKNYIFKYLGNIEFKCLTHSQGYYTNGILIGLLINKDNSTKILTKAEAEKKLGELKNEI